MKIEKDGKTIYVCECGKEFDKRKAFIGHCGHCEKHLGHPVVFISPFSEEGGHHKKSKEGGWECRECHSIFRTKAELYNHLDSVHHCISHRNITKICPYCGKGFKGKRVEHFKICEKKPHGPHKWTEEEKRNLSEKVKLAHKEGRHPGFTQLNKEQCSYPEKWLIKFLKDKLNLIEGIHYEREKYYHGLYLDFLFPATKQVIEMDGNQHYVNGRTKQDIKKDNFLKQEGYTELRIPWSDCKKDTKKWVKIITDFLLKDNLNIAEENKKFIEDYDKQIKQQLIEKEKRYKEFEQLGQIDKMGRATSSKNSNEEWERRKNLILNSGIDLFKFGFREKLIKITKLTRREIEGTIKHFNIDCYNRKKYSKGKRYGFNE